MFSRASLATLFLPALLANLVIAQTAEPLSSARSDKPAIPILSGKVVGSNGHPLPAVHVELDDAGTALPVGSTYTRPDGTFELYNISQGNYEVVADVGNSRVSGVVAVPSNVSALELRFPPSNSADNADDTISVTEILVPEKARQIYRKAREAFNQGKEARAEKLLDKALLIEPNYANALIMKGYIEMQNGQIQIAQQDLQRALRIDPNSPAAYIALGAVYNHEGRFDDALQVSQRGASLSPRVWQGYFEMARAAVGKGMYRKALLLLRQAERLGGSNFAGLHLMKACALYPLKFYKDARYELKAVLSRESKGMNAKQAQILLAQIDAADPRR